MRRRWRRPSERWIRLPPPTNAANDPAIEEKLEGVTTSYKEAAEVAKNAEKSAAEAATSLRNNSIEVENMAKVEETAEAAKKAEKAASDSAKVTGTSCTRSAPRWERPPSTRRQWGKSPEPRGRGWARPPRREL